MKKFRLILLTGISGSGKSTALNALEDLGFFCVDNLPASLVMPFADDILKKIKGEVLETTNTKYALLLDCRGESSFPLIQKAHELLNDSGVEMDLVFLDCSDHIAIRRFSETRRKHPLLGEGSGLKSITEALHRERELLNDFRNAASRVIDTSRTSVHELRQQIEDFCETKKTLVVTFQSFGFKHGVPTDIDLLFDVRFLPNPHFIDELRPQTGLSVDVREFVLRTPEANEFLDQINKMLLFLLPKYQSEGKQYLTIGIGCTGGKHRSVAMAEELMHKLSKSGALTKVFHRDIP